MMLLIFSLSYVAKDYHQNVIASLIFSVEEQKNQIELDLQESVQAVSYHSDAGSNKKSV